MSQETQNNSKIQKIRDAVWLVAILTPVVSFTLLLLVTGYWTMFGESYIEKTRDVLGITENERLILRALGEDRVIRENPYLSYVFEPVHVGDPVTVTLVVETTEWGSGCGYVGGNSFYFMPNGRVQSAGPIPPFQQITNDQDWITITADPPRGIGLDQVPTQGRWAIYHEFKFDCSGEEVIETTIPLRFDLRVL